MLVPFCFLFFSAITSLLYLLISLCPSLPLPFRCFYFKIALSRTPRYMSLCETEWNACFLSKSLAYFGVLHIIIIFCVWVFSQRKWFRTGARFLRKLSTLHFPILKRSSISKLAYDH